jgi:hypothetical protein
MGKRGGVRDGLIAQVKLYSEPLSSCNANRAKQ